MFKTNALSAAALAYLATIALPTLAQEQPAQQLERVSVTGSAIKRTNVEGPAPVEILTRKQIEKTGATSINELLRSIPSIDIFDQGELASNSPSGSGTANIKMRGLSSSEVLVLVNGRRAPVSALYDSSGAGAAFDINTLPIGAIERIEILKDGGSAIYGADAVAGVVNFITKTDYQGIEATASYGQSSRNDGKEKRVGLAAGFGDLTKDRFNILFGLDYLKRDPILRKDRELSSSVDFRRYGGLDARSSFAPTGNVIDPNTGSFVGVTYADCPADSLNGTRCRYDFNKSLLTAYNGADRLSAMTVANFQVTNDVKAFAEVIYSTSKDHFDAHPVPDYFIVPITNANQKPYEILDANGNGTNTVYIAGRFMQGGPRMTNRKSDFLNVATGLEGSVGNYDWKVNLSRGESKVNNHDFNYYDAAKWADATTSGKLNPTVTTNDEAYVQSLKVDPQRTGKSVLSTLNAQLSGDVMPLPAGMLRFAVGLSVNRETLSDQPDKIIQEGNVVGGIAQSAVEASRTFKAVYGELSIPVLKNVEAQAAVRYDKYPNASATSPKLGVKWSVLPTLALRASYSGSFRAPVLKQLYGGQEQGATTVTDPASCTKLGVALDSNGECQVAAFQVNGSNANLQPEKGKSWNVGAVFEAGSTFNASVDWWRINKTNDISTPTIASAIQQGLFTKNGARFDIFTNLQNFAEHQVEGVDIDARLRFPGTRLGNVSVRNLTTYYVTNKSRSGASDPWADYNGTYVYPRFRNNLILSTDIGPWSYNVSWKTVGGFWDTDNAYPIAAGTRRVGGYETADVLVQYDGFKSWELGLGIQNLMDRMPPLSLTNANSNTYTQMGFAELYTNRGRFFYVSAKYTFR
ncbi:TonB-dependent receptor [Roseateles sp. BYS78W]|uniref:TonB-dependent receptor n=1 Tax=Pelomonas candidula TaxID=3299025 RepID=A0ABW7H669_9BURK